MGTYVQLGQAVESVEPRSE